MTTTDLTLNRVNCIANPKHKAQYCALCGRIINKYKYKGQVYEVEVHNSFGQPSNRHSCEKCAKKALRKELKDIPDNISRLQGAINHLKERQRLLESDLGPV